MDTTVVCRSLRARSLPGGKVSAAAKLAAMPAVGLLLVVAFVRLINVASAFQRLEHLEIGYVLLCGAFYLGAYVIRGLRWRRFLMPSPVSAGRAIAIYQVATLVNFLLPVRGGELVKVALLRRLNRIPLSRSLPTVTMDKSMDLLPALALVCLVPFVGLQLSRPLWVLLVSALALLALGALLLAGAVWKRELAPAILNALSSRLPRRLGQRVEPFALEFLEVLLGLITRPRLLAVTAAYTAAAVCMDALSCWMAFKAVGSGVGFPAILVGYTLFNLAFILPTPPGQIGSNELIGLLIFSGVLHMNRSVVAAMFLFNHPWAALLMVVSGLVCLSAMGVSLRSTLTLSGEEATTVASLAAVDQAAG